MREAAADMQRSENARARKARHRDTVVSALLAAGAIIGLIVGAGERELRPLLVVGCLVCGLTLAFLDLRRVERRELAGPRLLATIVVTAVVYVVLLALGH
jgi:hypothetical protein